MEGATAGATVRLGDVARLVVYSDPDSEAVAQEEQMASGAAANINDPHPVRDHVMKKVEFGAHKDDGDPEYRYPTVGE